jgi:hypothetical protein
MLRLSSSIGLAARAMRVAPARVMRPASARARQISTPSATSTTGNKAAAFGVHLTGGRRMPEKFTKPSAAGAISYVFEEGRGGITLGGIFARADTDRCEPNRTSFQHCRANFGDAQSPTLQVRDAVLLCMRRNGMAHEAPLQHAL